MKQIAQMIDHTALKPDTVKSQIETLCKEAVEHEFASVCVNPYWVPLCAKLLQGSDVKVCTVIGFPLGASAAATKAFETKQAMAYGADEIDMVMNIGALKDRDTGTVEKDIQAVTDAAEGKALVKVIIETALLTDEEKKLACELSVKAGADFVKTSTGFSGGGATAEDIRLMRETVGPNIGVKASGGIRDKESALVMIEAGATRIGASAGLSIISGLKADQGY